MPCNSGRMGGGSRKGGMSLVDVAVPALLLTANSSYNRKKSRLYRGSRNKLYSRRRSNKTRRNHRR